jgi:excisionase family DNA binding protein
MNEGYSMVMAIDKRLMTVKKASQTTGLSRWMFYRLLKEGKLTKYYVHTAVCISLAEFEQIAASKN